MISYVARELFADQTFGLKCVILVKKQFAHPIAIQLASYPPLTVQSHDLQFPVHYHVIPCLNSLSLATACDNNYISATAIKGTILAILTYTC